VADRGHRRRTVITDCSRAGDGTHPRYETQSWAGDVACGPWPARSVVVGFDASPSSRAALAYASGWAHRNQAALTIVYVDSLAGMAVLESLNAISPVPIPGLSRPDMAREVGVMMAGLTVPWTYRPAIGSVAEQLETIADELRADAIIVGRSRRGTRILRRSVPGQLALAPHHIIVVVP
jgi:nucleotide-binding universal stress UspA family protein